MVPASLSDHLVIGISSRALFDLSVQNAIYDREGLAAYRNHQRGCEDDLLKPGPGFPLVKALLSLNQLLPGKRKVEVVVMSRNTAETSLRISNSIEHYGLDITRFALVGGASLVPYLHAFNVGLLLSKHQDDVQEAVDGGTAVVWRTCLVVTTLMQRANAWPICCKNANRCRTATPRPPPASTPPPSAPTYKPWSPPVTLAPKANVAACATSWLQVGRPHRERTLIRDSGLL